MNVGFTLPPGNSISINVPESQSIKTVTSEFATISITSDNQVSLDITTPASNSLSFYPPTQSVVKTSLERQNSLSIYPYNQIPVVEVVQGTDAKYGVFYSTSMQPSLGANVKNTMSFPTADIASGITVVDGNKLKFLTYGVYNVQFSAQFDKTDSGVDHADVWFSQNGTDVKDSNTRIELDKNNAKMVAAWNYLVRAENDDYVQIHWAIQAILVPRVLLDPLDQLVQQDQLDPQALLEQTESRLLEYLFQIGLLQQPLAIIPQ